MRIKALESSELSVDGNRAVVKVTLQTETAVFTVYGEGKKVQEAQRNAIDLCMMLATNSYAYRTQTAELEPQDEQDELELEPEAEPEHVDAPPAAPPTPTKVTDAGKRFAIACSKLNQSWRKEHISALAKLMSLVHSPEEAADFASSCTYPRQLALKALECYYGSIDEVKRQATLKPLSQYSIFELTDWCMELANKTDEREGNK